MATALGPRSGGKGSRGGRGDGKAAKVAKREQRRQRRDRRRERLSQLRAAYTMTKRSDPRLGLILAGVGLGVLLVFVLIGLLLNHPVYFGVLGLLTALAAMAVVFGRRAQKAAYASMEGQLGAAVGVLQSLRRGWTVTPTVAVTRSQDVVHRAVGRPGIVLVGEGSPGRVVGLLAQERKKMGRLVPDVPVHEFQAGTGAGQVPLQQLQRKITKLPRQLAPAQVSEVDKRLSAMGTVRVPVPKGPMPRGARIPRNPRAPR